MIVRVQNVPYTVSLLEAKPEFLSGITWGPGPDNTTVCMADYGPDTASRRSMLTFFVPGLQEGRSFLAHFVERNRYGQAVTLELEPGEEIFGPHIQYTGQIAGYLFETEMPGNAPDGLATTGIVVRAEFRPKEGVGSFLYTATPALPDTGKVYIQNVKRDMAKAGPAMHTTGTGITVTTSPGLSRVQGATVSIVCHRDYAAPLLAYLEQRRGDSFPWPYDWANSWLFTADSGGTSPSVVVLDVVSDGPVDAAGTFQGVTVTLGKAL